MGEGEEVRAPLPTMRDTLMGGPPMMGSGIGPRRAASLRGLGGGGMGMVHAGAMNGMMGAGDDPSLDWMFKVPEGLSCNAPFQEARGLAKAAQKWLLVNVQDFDNFASHRLNRDIWAHDTIHCLVDSGFLFWQRDKSTPEGQQFLSRYHIQPDALPVIAIIDPRTGGKVREWMAATMKAMDLSTILADFLNQNSLDSLAAPRVQQRSSSFGSIGRKDSFSSTNSNDTPPRFNSNSNSGSNTPSSLHPSRSSSLPPSQGTEDEDLARAIALSMREATPGGGKEGGREVDEEEEEEGGNVNEGGREGAAAEEEEEEMVVRDIIPVPEEPPAGTSPSAMAHIQFRFPDGKRARRYFFKTERVKGLYAYVESMNREALRKVGPPTGLGAELAVATRDYELVIPHPALALNTVMDQTLEEAGLDNQSIMMRFLDG